MEPSICGWLARALHIRPSHSRHRLYRRLRLYSITRLGTSFAKLALDTQRLLSYRDSNVSWLDVLWHFLYYTTNFILTIRKELPLSAVAEMAPLVIGGLFATASVGIFIPKAPAQYIFGVSMFSLFIGNLLMSFAIYSKVYWAFIFPACLLVVGGPDLSFASSGILIWKRGLARGARCGRIVYLSGGAILDCHWPRYCYDRRVARQ